MRSVKTYSQTSQTFKTIHRSLLDTLDVTFRVRALSDAKLVLLSTPGNTNTPCYEIDIGVQGNSKSVLRVRSVIGAITVEQDTVNILSITELRSFWVSWSNGTLKFGSGSISGTATIASIVDPEPTYRKDVHSIAVASETNLVAEWEFGDAFDAGTYLSRCLFNLDNIFLYLIE